MPEKSKWKSFLSGKNESGPKGPFNLNAVLEANARDVLGERYGAPCRNLPQELAAAKSMNQDYSLTLGDLREVGDISGTQAFAGFRAKVLKEYPDVKDVCFRQNSAD